MCTCPRCGTQSLRDRFENLPFDQIASGALTAKQAGRPAHAVIALLIWGGVEVVNYFRDGWTCPHCQYRFTR